MTLLGRFILLGRKPIDEITNIMVLPSELVLAPAEISTRHPCYATFVVSPIERYTYHYGQF
jgi:hypothetical protein